MSRNGKQFRDKDFTYMWWANGVRDISSERRLNILTDNYGLSIDPQKLNIDRLGCIPETSLRKAGEPNNDLINALPVASTSFSAEESGIKYTMDNAPDRITYFSELPREEFERWSCLDTGHEYQNTRMYSYRMIESGRYVQRFDIYDIPMHSGGKTADFTGHVELVALPEYFSLVYHLFPKRSMNACMELSIELSSEFSILLQESGEACRSLSLINKKGDAITFVVPKLPCGTPTLTLNGTKVTIALKDIPFDAPKKESEHLCETEGYWYRNGINILIIPSRKGSLLDANKIFAYEQLEVCASQGTTFSDSFTACPAAFNPERGVIEIKADNVRTVFSSDEYQNDMEIIDFKVRNPRGGNVRVPVVFTTHNDTLLNENISGQMCFAPFMCDADGVPNGNHVHASMNWHAEFEGIGSVLYDKAWKRMTAMIDVPAGGEVHYQLRIAYQKWGGVTKVSHEQLSIIGWGNNQLWEVQALGSIFENTCYEAEGMQRYDGAMIDDCRPLYVLMGENGRKWQATNNVGGGNFLVLEKDGVRQFPGPVKTMFLQHGPNQSVVSRRFITSDGSIEADITITGGRTDDVVRFFHNLNYRVLKDVEFSRLAFYQLGSDGYNDHPTYGFACGNEDGLIKDFTVSSYPLKHEEGSRYMENAYRIPLPGRTPWVSLYKEYMDDHNRFANRMFAVRGWKAVLGGEYVDHPSVSVYNTLAQGLIEGGNWELSPPAGLTHLCAGDYVQCSLEYVIFPQFLADYYGPEQELMSRILEVENSWHSAYFEAVNNDVKAAALCGTLIQQNPVIIAAESDAAEVSITGGVGYLPLTFTGLSGYRGYSLEQFVDGKWFKVDQSVHGNDYWQTNYDDASATYSLTYNVRRNADGKTDRYRLIKE